MKDFPIEVELEWGLGGGQRRWISREKRKPFSGKYKCAQSHQTGQAAGIRGQHHDLCGRVCVGAGRARDCWVTKMNPV